MSIDTFAFLIHPLDPRRDVARKYPTLAQFPGWLIEFLSIFYPPVFISEVKGVQSRANGRRLKGWFIACPLSAHMMTTLPISVVYQKIIQSGRMAERLGARILGLGAFTSVVGDGGITVSKALNIPVTTGNSYTVATSLQAIRHAAKRLQINLDETTVAVVGASGALGSICAQLMAPEVRRLILVGRRMQDLQSIAAQAMEAGVAYVETTTDISRIKQAEVVITVTSSVKPLIQPQDLHTGAIVCDVARPRDVAGCVSAERPDVLVFEGGVVQVPGNVDFGFNFGFPPGMAYACMAETMALALEGRYESYTIGKRLRLDQVVAIDEIAGKHGFQLGGLRNFDRPLTEGEVTTIARRRLTTLVPDPAPVGRNLPVTV